MHNHMSLLRNHVNQIWRRTQPWTCLGCHCLGSSGRRHRSDGWPAAHWGQSAYEGPASRVSPCTNFCTWRGWLAIRWPCKQPNRRAIPILKRCVCLIHVQIRQLNSKIENPIWYGLLMSWLTLRSSTPNRFSVNILKSVQCGFSVSRCVFVSSFRKWMSVLLPTFSIVLPYGALFISLKNKRCVSSPAHWARCTRLNSMYSWTTQNNNIILIY